MAATKRKTATTPTGRPRLGGEMDILAGDGETWLPCRVRMVSDGRDQHGQSVIGVMFEYLDDEGGVSELVRWDSLTWRERAS